MSRNLLHKNKLEEFKSWLDSQEIPHRPGTGEWQILGIQYCRSEWWYVCERIKMPEHYSVDKRLDQLVRRFCKESRS